ncbi:site-specific integrase [Herbiconiux sp. CPCC 203407]|uniref:Site-specific integrase n=1 Tax=Herbiconiux oxytropis TaxID=2970915 RepID=A0AA42BS70_9MICO|nr:site-specific integrase [Herbiconiux oxytropis]MCS5720748.1 site-specific integrase [Herbiconiux oxytropis]MCS5724925.1 site-specific integrase [Herbiconiux oxytropis]
MGTFAKRKEATAAIAKVQTSMASGSYAGPKSGAVPLSVYAADYFEHGGYAFGTLSLYRNKFKSFVEPHLGDPLLSKITAPRIKKWFDTDLLKGGATRVASDTEHRQTYTILHGIFRQAEEDELIAENPCQIRGAATPQSPTRPYMSVESFEKIRDAHQEHLKLALDTAYYAHLLPGELVALKKADLDRKTRRLTIERHGIDVRGGIQITKTKTHVTRHPTIPASLVERLVSMIESHTDCEPWQFVRPNGHHHTRHALESSWKATDGQGRASNICRSFGDISTRIQKLYSKFNGTRRRVFIGKTR